MHFVVITHVLHKRHEGRYYAYGPYVREMNLWIRHVDEVTVVAPLVNLPPDAIDLPYVHERIRFVPVPAISFTTLSNAIRALWNLPGILFRIWSAMRWADHIHLRCPGNMGLLGCLVQIAFPETEKTAKYAGNWDPASSQPWSYRIQRALLLNTTLTQNMQALVYGHWPDATRNIRPFFTASYAAREAKETRPRDLAGARPVRLIFVGALHAGKRSLLALQVTERLRQLGVKVHLDMYGDGPDYQALESYIHNHDLETSVTLHGNVSAEQLKQAYQQSHFLVFPSKSEGWPKAVAEAMFWGCLPLTTPVSCVPEMLGQGSRGDLVQPEVEGIAQRVLYYLDHPREYQQKVAEAMEWSRQYTLDRFEQEIRKLLQAAS